MALVHLSSSCDPTAELAAPLGPGGVVLGAPEALDGSTLAVVLDRKHRPAFLSPEGAWTVRPWAGVSSRRWAKRGGPHDGAAVDVTLRVSVLGNGFVRPWPVPSWWPSPEPAGRSGTSWGRFTRAPAAKAFGALAVRRLDSAPPGSTVLVHRGGDTWAPGIVAGAPANHPQRDTV